MPTAAARVNPELPDALDRAIGKALDKDRDLRHQSAADLRGDLKRVQRDSSDPATPALAAPAEADPPTQPVADSASSSDAAVAVGLLRRHPTSALAGLAAVVLLGAGAVYWGTRPSVPAGGEAIDSVAVLPFENVGGDPDTAYLSDGIAESLINDLSTLPNLRVVPRGIAFAYRDQTIDLQTIGEELNVRAVITGRVSQSGDTLVIGAELTDVVTVAQLWGERYTRPATDLIALHTEVTTAIARNLRPALGGEAEARFAERGTSDEEAYQLYLRGLFHDRQGTLASLFEARRYYERAIERDPGYAAPPARFAMLMVILGNEGVVPAAEAYPLAREAAAQALELNDTLSVAHSAMAWVKMYADWDLTGAEQSVGRALELDSNEPLANRVGSRISAFSGRPAEAVARARRGVDLEPLAPIAGFTLIRTLYYVGRHDDALAQVEATLELDPNYALARMAGSQVYLAQGRHDAALEVLEVGEALFGQVPMITAVRATTLAGMGRPEEARALVPALEEGGGSGNVE